MGIRRQERAGALVVDVDSQADNGHRGRVLLMTQLWKRPEGQPVRWYHLPGGGIDPGETPEQAATRELFEETGLRGACGRRFLTVATNSYRHHYFVFDCDDLTLGAVTGPEVEQGHVEDYGFESVWVDVDDVPSLFLWPQVLRELIVDFVRTGTIPDPDVEVDDPRPPWHGVLDGAPPARRQRTLAVVIDEDDTAAARVLVTTTTPPRLPTDDEAGVVTGPRLAVVEREGVPDDGVRTFVRATLPGEAPTGTTWLALDELTASGIEPEWLPELLPGWIEDPDPTRPDRFYD